MALASFSNLSTQHLFSHYNHPSLQTCTITIPHGTLIFFPSKLKHCTFITSTAHFFPTTVTAISRVGPRIGPPLAISSAGDGGRSSGSGGGGESGGGGDEEEEERDRNREEVMVALAEAGRSLESFPEDLAAAVTAGRVPGSIVRRLFQLEESAVLGWLLKFGGFRERLLADDLFLAKLLIECVVIIFTKAAAELERRKEKFTKELNFVVANVVTGIVTGFVLVWFPAPTISLKPPLAVSAGPIAKLFYGCPDNAFQVALPGTSYTLLQRIGAIVRNGAKLFVVGTGASLVGIGITNALINVQKAVNKTFTAEAENLPIISTSVAFGVYMVVISNLRYQVLAGIIEQRILEPLLHRNKLILTATYFTIRTANTYWGSLLWVDFARWVGVQKIKD
ncbi:protein RETICULATA-RELATED 4, chloroplastic-like isoform X1 [Glycine soja]|uniref:Protein RETICULATA-RELATED 4, chloroplastic isoform A n=2 Tax=Glycine soja TaxID=3848 RepID=A0A445I1U4_GLYSO|nr:protein RETICULATA-RELATED 4, chloroplastic-like isoform X1 [Glycine soja]RZB80090.1 Protein RETICULATA-RELATED 4, chloroplastic isoform A [Glycine soja]